MNVSCNYDGLVLTYIPNYELTIGNTDKHSFVRFDEITKNPVEFVEKTVISNQALVGVHYYNKGSHFVKSAEYLFENNIRAPNGEFYLSYTYQVLLNMGYNIGTYCLQETEHFYPVGEPEDYFKYYNMTSAFFNTHISNYETINIYDCFKIKKGIEGQTVVFTNSLFIQFNEPLCYTTGKYMEYTFSKNTYYLQVPNILKEYSVINIDHYIRGWLIGNFEPSIINTTEFEIGVLNHKKDEKWAFHYHEKTREINILLEGEMIINNIPLHKDTIFIFESNMISCPLFLTDCIVLCIKLPSLPNDKTII